MHGYLSSDLVDLGLPGDLLGVRATGFGEGPRWGSLAVRLEPGEHNVRPCEQLRDHRPPRPETPRIDHSRRGAALRMFQAGDRILDLAQWGFGVTTFDARPAGLCALPRRTARDMKPAVRAPC